MIVTGDHQHAAMARRTRRVGMLEYVAAAIDARPFAVPHAEDAVEAGAIEHGDLLTPPDTGGGKVFVDARSKIDVVALEEGAGLPQGLVESAQG